jgi:uncharacterized membrane protein
MISEKEKGGILMVYSEIRRQARDNLRGHWGQAVIVAMVAGLLGGGITSASSSAGGSAGSSSGTLDLEAFQSLPPEVMHAATTILGVVGILALVGFIIGGTVQLGYSVYLLKQYHRQETSIGDLFSQFFRFGTGFAQKCFVNLYTILWTLLFVIPGIVKGFSYAMTPFILADNPNLTANQAITRSRELMDGHKWELFVLSLTFIGWEILGALCFGIGLLWVTPYKNAAYAAFYRQIAGYPKYTVE